MQVSSSTRERTGDPADVSGGASEGDGGWTRLPSKVHYLMPSGGPSSLVVLSVHVHAPQPILSCSCSCSCILFSFFPLFVPSHPSSIPPSFTPPPLLGYFVLGLVYSACFTCLFRLLLFSLSSPFRPSFALFCPFLLTSISHQPISLAAAMTISHLHPSPWQQPSLLLPPSGRDLRLEPQGPCLLPTPLG